MYRKRNGSFGFSFTNFLDNAVPSLVLDTHRFDYVPSLGRDMLYAHSLASKHANAPCALDERSLFVGGICESESISVRVFHKLAKAGVIDNNDCVDTRRIEGKKFAHQIAILSVARQRQLINLLFWWEEECVRLRKLISEESDLSKNIIALEKGESLAEDIPAEILNDDQERQQLIEHLKFEREKLRMRIRQKPSERREDVESGTDALYAQAQTLQQDKLRAQSVPDARQQRQEADPPSYRP